MDRLPDREMPSEACVPAALRQSKRLRVIVGLAALSLLSGCSGGVLDPRGPIADANAKILLNALEIMLVIVVPTIVAALVFAWWFRASNTRARYRPDWVYSGRIELIVWAIPLLVILFLGGVIWIGAHDLDPFKPIEPRERALEVQVVSLDWKWLFIYPELGVASVNEIVVPLDTPLHFSLTSASVMNMFFVPQLGSMIATMNGMVTQLHLKADHAGSYLRSVHAIQRRRFFRHALHAARGDARRIRSMDRDRAPEPGPRSISKPMSRSPSRARTSRPTPIARSSRCCFAISSPSSYRRAPVRRAAAAGPFSVLRERSE